MNHQRNTIIATTNDVIRRKCNALPMKWVLCPIILIIERIKLHPISSQIIWPIIIYAFDRSQNNIRTN